MRIGILGGSFDPVHRGHLALAREAQDRLHLDRVLLMVSSLQPHKPDGAHASADDRFAMAALLAREEPWLEASDMELRREGASYTVETLRALRESADASDQWVLLLGADAFADFPRWRNAPEIDALAEVVAFGRQGTEFPTMEEVGASLGAERACALLDAVQVADLPDVSSTEIRRRLANGENVDGLLTEDVAAYIEQRGLYAS
ncbi:MAG: nicotinate-nucleotide adenylyltransferase [Planctomycetota bacterium]|jgi:nicotinate-nucleotide adenylyltransferase